MDAFLNQVFAGLANGGIYASVALALVMIYQATHHVNFAQGEMAMFSTYIAWSPDQRRHALLAGVFPHGRDRIRARRAGRAHHRAPGGEGAGAVGGGRLHRPAGDIQQPRRLVLHLHHQGVSEPVSETAAALGRSLHFRAPDRRRSASPWWCWRCCTHSSASPRSAWRCARRRRIRNRAAWSASASAGCWRWAGASLRRSARLPA